MIRNRMIKAIALTLCASMIMGTPAANYVKADESIVKDEQNQVRDDNEADDSDVTNSDKYGEIEGESYIVTADRKKIHYIEKNYDNNLECNYDEYESSDGNILSMTLSEAEAVKLDNIRGVTVEEDISVEACQLNVKPSRIKESKLVHGLEQVYKKMIKADNTYAESDKNGSSNEIEEMCSVESSGKKVKVAIIDSGIDGCSDVEVTGRINLVPGQEEVTPFLEDETGHGTAIAGIIAGKGVDTDVIGINPNAELYSAKVFDGTNSAPLSRVIEGIYWAIDNEVDIINLSFGIHNDLEALKIAVDKAMQNGILVIAAVGNDENAGVMYPAAYEGVLAVGSVDTNAEHSNFSAKGEEVDVVAVGEQVVTTGVLDGVMVTEGTSMAVPQVAAVASVILEKHPDATSDVLQEVIKRSASYLGEEESNGYGLVNLEQALEIYDVVVENLDVSTEEYINNKSVLNTDSDMNIICELGDSVVDAFETPDCVTGQWTGKDHQGTVDYGKTEASYTSAQIQVIKAGATFPDECNYNNKNAPKGHVCLQGLSKKRHGKYNGPWHGNNNYVKTFRYLYYFALGKTTEKNKVYNVKSNSVIRGLNRVYKEKNNKIDTSCAVAIKLKNIGQSVNKDNAKLFVFGMSLHVVADVYAHRTKIKMPGTSSFVKPTHYIGNDKNYCITKGYTNKLVPDCNCLNHVPKRFTAAKQAVKKAFTYITSGKTSGLKSVYDVSALDGSKYKIANFKKLVGNKTESSKTMALNSVQNYGISTLESVTINDDCSYYEYDSEDEFDSYGTSFATAKRKTSLEALLFNKTFYYWLYSDLRAALSFDDDTLKNHYNNFGKKEGRVASPLFNPLYYIEAYDDVAEYCNGNDYAKAYEHFVNIGFWEGRQGSDFFDVNYYLNHYVDLQNAFGVNYLAAAQHFIWNGINEGRYAAQEFRICDYMNYNQDLVNLYGRDFLSYYIHYSWIGWSEDRICTIDNE